MFFLCYLTEIERKIRGLFFKFPNKRQTVLRKVANRPLVVHNKDKGCGSQLRAQSCRNGLPGGSREGSNKNEKKKNLRYRHWR